MLVRASLAACDAEIRSSTLWLARSTGSSSAGTRWTGTSKSGDSHTHGDGRQCCGRACPLPSQKSEAWVISK